ncbi:dockerin type I domain-containing protein [Mucisphaera calidilacus]|uniref:Uncharacterized protein n=1 Tax=Mucisphaera calidilacus TaxID=2527982 RepID=A0A518BX30_9BACT|nr:dockerin type I domain-containing protein [Mucisphaera calidilacus]QDU71526.1 hypothetical protein Pan265_13760 [Mucisphaera calidilacus]
MSLQTLNLTTTAALALTLAATHAVSSQTLITDTFERETGLINGELPPFNLSDWGTADNGVVDGKTGSILDADYITTLAGNGNEQTVGLTTDPPDSQYGEIRFGRVILDVNLATVPEIQQAGGFAIEFDINPADLGSNGGNGRDWGGFILADTNSTTIIGGALAIAKTNNQSVRFGAAPRNSGTVLLRPRQNLLLGDGNPFDGSINEPIIDQTVFDDYSSNWDPQADPIEDFLNPKFYRLRAEITSDFSEGAPSSARLYIGETGQPLTQIDLDGNAGNGVSDSDFSWGVGGSAYIAFLGNTQTHLFDNLLIEALASDPGLPGDFNNDGVVDALDIDLLTGAVRDSSSEPQYDLDENGTVDAADLDAMITDVIGTLFGDANLDQTVDLLDLSALASNFEGTAGWAGGNFNTDTSVDLLDLSTLASNFNQSAPTVPEPTGLILMGIGASLAARRRQ